jgi:hypothetical protein
VKSGSLASPVRSSMQSGMQPEFGVRKFPITLDQLDPSAIPLVNFSVFIRLLPW